MPNDAVITIRLDSELGAKVQELHAELVPTIEAAGDLATAAEQLLDFIPPNVSPVVLTRDRIADLQAAYDAFVEAAGTILERRQGA